MNSWGRDLTPGPAHRVRRAPARLRRGRRDRADPLHEPAPEGLPRAGDRGDRRVRGRLRAGAPAAPVRLVADPQGDAAHLRRASATCASPRSCAPRCPTSRSARTSSSASPARPRGTSPRRSGRRGRALRQRVHVHLLAAPRHRGGRHARPGAATRSSTSASSGSSRSCSGSPPSGTPQRVGRVEEVLVEGASRTDPSLLRGRTRRNTTVNFAGDAEPGRARGRRRRRARRRRRWRPPGGARRRVGRSIATSMPRERRLAWDGCSTSVIWAAMRPQDGRRLASALSYAPTARASSREPGGQALSAYGVCRIVDLRDDAELADDAPRASRPSRSCTCALLDGLDAESYADGAVRAAATTDAAQAKAKHLRSRCRPMPRPRSRTCSEQSPTRRRVPWSSTAPRAGTARGSSPRSSSVCAA